MSENPVADAQTAADEAVVTAELSASSGVAEAEIAYSLTYQMIQQNQGALAIPLCGLAAAAIAEGLTAYEREQAAATAAFAAATRLFQDTLQSCESAFADAERSLRESA
jgi:hypothetical protein